MIRSYFILLCVLLFSNFGFAQDAGITTYNSPTDGCDKGVDEEITVVVINNSSAPFIPGGQITANYSINGGTAVQEPLSTPINLGSTFVFTFSQDADLSACNQDFLIKVWIDYAADTNPNNDTIVWTVRNDCTIIPGQVQNDETVCHGNNSNTLSLNGWQNGTITNWVYSEDNGATWITIPNTSSSHTFTDLTTETLFAVDIEGGICGDDRSSPALISIQNNPLGGTISGPDTLCSSSTTNVLTLSGNTMPVQDWEYSEDNGMTWVSTGNTSTTENVTNLTQTILYRVKIDGGVCSDVYSDTLEIFVVEESNGGVLSQDQTICESEDVTLSLNSYIGNIQEWQYSTDGVIWNTINPVNTSDTYTSDPLTSSTYFRVMVKNGICSVDYSNEVLITVDPVVNPGTISGGADLCESNATGVLTLNGNSGSVINWESSNDEGLNWNIIPNTTNSENYNNLTETTWYRALIDGGSCVDTYSDTAYIIISPLSFAGVLYNDTTICEGDSLRLNLENNIGSVIDWEESVNGTAWTSLNSVDSSFLIPNVYDTKQYRVIVKSGVCDEDTTNIITVTKADLPSVDAGIDTTIVKGDTVQLSGSGGVLALWTPGNRLSDSTIYDPLAYPNKTTTYTLTVINIEGCINSDEVFITVDPGIPPIDVKNLITPNNDGANDTWIIVGIEAYPNVAVRVYNLYGQLVYENENYSNDWGGTFKNKQLPSGTYWYIVELGGTEEILKGNLTILKDE